jgi:hypothetical protein
VLFCSFFTISLSSLLKIFPLGLFGIASKYTTPPLNCLCCARFSFTNALIASSEVFDLSATTYARGNSFPLPLGSGTPMTAASRILSWESSSASSSAGATCRPLYLMSS